TGRSRATDVATRRATYQSGSELATSLPVFSCTDLKETQRWQRDQNRRSSKRKDKRSGVERGWKAFCFSEWCGQSCGTLGRRRSNRKNSQSERARRQPSHE